MWSTHSRRIDPISRSAKPFCQGEAGAVGLSRMPMARNRRVTTAAINPVAIADEVVPVGNSILLATDIESGDAPALCERSVGKFGLRWSSVPVAGLA